MPIRKTFNIAVAVLSAALVPVFVASILGSPSKLNAIYISYVFVVALTHAVVLGLPLFLIADRKGWVNWLSCILVGFVIGGVPAGVLFWPSSNADFVSIDGVPVTVDGVTTLAGWIIYLGGIVVKFGILGAAGGLGFWLVVKWDSKDRQRSVGDANAAPLAARSITIVLGYKIFSATVMALSILVIALPFVTEDRSCHNMFRDGRDNIAPVLRVDLQIPNRQWPDLVDLLKEFAANQGLSFRDSGQDRSVPTSYGYVSLCNETGLTINALEIGKFHIASRGQSVLFYKVQEAAEWKELAHRLIVVLNKQWPEKVGFRDELGRSIPSSEALTPE